MKTDFLPNLQLVVESATKFIQKNTPSNQTIRFIEKDFDTSSDPFWDLPLAIYHGKYGERDEYGIIGISKNADEKIVIHGHAKGEVDKEQRDFTLDDLEPSDICALADLLGDSL